MRVLVVSDSHGRKERLDRIVREAKADHVIHCGDFCTSFDELPKGPLTVVRGNCDWEDVPEEEMVVKGEVPIFVTHGHRYRVHSSLLPLKYRAEEAGARVACFGHTHFPLCEFSGGVLLINPGSIASPRGFYDATYAVMEWSDPLRLRVTYFNTRGEVVDQRGGLFSLA